MKGIEGSTLGRYELRRRIAQGGMSEVYLGYDRRVKRLVAVKVLYGSNEPFVRRFEREALAVGALSHEHILPLYDFGEQRPWYYLVMPFVEGGTLRDYVFKRERLTLEEAGIFLEQIANALQYAHDHGVVHRDVKPSNILLRSDGHAYLVDFGLAKAKMEVESLAHSGAIVGTPEYMAPEQSNGQNDYRSDIYSLGIILYQMLTGRVPFIAESPVAVTLKHMQTPPQAPSEFNSEIPEAIEEVILKALAKKPEERFQDARAFATAYKKALLQELASRQGLEWTDSDDMPTSITAGLPDIEIRPPANIQITPLFDLAATSPRHRPLWPEALSLKRPLSWKKKTSYLIITALLCLMLLGSILPSGQIWRTHSPPAAKGPAHPPLAQAARQDHRATAQAQATLAAQARVQVTAGITAGIGAGNLLYYDDLISPGGGWIDDGTQCYFSPQGYHVYTSLAHTVAWCYTNQQQFSDVAITAQAQLLHGDLYGFVFRLNPASKAFYVLEINSNGAYRLQRAMGSDFSRWLTLIDWTRSSAILDGYGQLNTLLIVATGTHFRFYVNQQLVVSLFSDATYPSGMVGFLVGGDTYGGTEAIFSHLAIFQK